MAASPKWKVYDSLGTYQAACKEPEAAACLVSFYGPGATIRLHHRCVMWVEGDDGDGDASESYDTTADVITQREESRRNESARRLHDTRGLLS